MCSALHCAGHVYHLEFDPPPANDPGLVARLVEVADTSNDAVQVGPQNDYGHKTGSVLLLSAMPVPVPHSHAVLVSVAGGSKWGSLVKCMRLVHY